MLISNTVSLSGNSDILPLDNVIQHLVLQEPFDFRMLDSYTGYGRVIRLIHIARRVPKQRSEAIEECMQYIRKNTSNYYLYQTLANKYKKVSSCVYKNLDNEWVNNVSQSYSNSKYIDDCYINELKFRQSIKSILSILTQAGKKAFEYGDFENALLFFSKSRDYCNTSSEVLDACDNIISTSLYINNTTNIYNHCAKADVIFAANIPSESFVQSEASNLQQQKIHLCTALAHLNDSEYASAARKLITLDFDVSEISETLTQRDIGLYTGLLSLASLDRDEINRNFHNNGSFQLFLQCYPEVKQCIVDWLSSRFNPFFRTLDAIYINLQLDVYLSNHVDNLYSLIRDRAYVQYFIPYSVVSIPKMMSAFTMSEIQLRVQILRLVNMKLIDARIDSEQNLVIKNKNVEVQVLFSKILKNMERARQMCTIDKLKSAMNKTFK